MKTPCWAGSELRKARTWERTTDVIKLLIVIETMIGAIKKRTLLVGKFAQRVTLVMPELGNDLMYLTQLTMSNGSAKNAIAATALLA